MASVSLAALQRAVVESTGLLNELSVTVAEYAWRSQLRELTLADHAKADPMKHVRAVTAYRRRDTGAAAVAWSDDHNTPKAHAVMGAGGPSSGGDLLWRCSSFRMASIDALEPVPNDPTTWYAIAPNALWRLDVTDAHVGRTLLLGAGKGPLPDAEPNGGPGPAVAAKQAQVAQSLTSLHVSPNGRYVWLTQGFIPNRVLLLDSTDNRIAAVLTRPPPKPNADYIFRWVLRDPLSPTPNLAAADAKTDAAVTTSGAPTIRVSAAEVPYQLLLVGMCELHRYNPHTGVVTEVPLYTTARNGHTNGDGPRLPLPSDRLRFECPVVTPAGFVIVSESADRQLIAIDARPAERGGQPGRCHLLLTNPQPRRTSASASTAAVALPVPLPPAQVPITSSSPLPGAEAEPTSELCGFNPTEREAVLGHGLQYADYIPITLVPPSATSAVSKPPKELAPELELVVGQYRTNKLYALTLPPHMSG